MSGIKLFQLARTFLIRNRPFYAAIVSDCVINLNWKENPIDSAIVNGRINMFINSDYMEANQVTPKDLALVLEQEINCLLNNHQMRSKNHEVGRYVMAAHIATSQLCQEQEMPEWSKRINYKDAKSKISDFPDKDKPAELYYEKIPKEDVPPEYGGEGEGESPPNQQQGEGEDKDEGKQPPKMQHGKAWEKTNTNEEQFNSIIRDIVKDAMNKTNGNVPGGIKHLIDQILRPPEIPWEEELKDFIQSKVTTDTEPSWKRRNRNYNDAPHIVKGRNPRFTSLFVIFIDTSGSVSDKNLNSFLSEMVGIHDVAMHTIVTVCIDYGFQSISEFDGDKKFEFKGRGGTSFDPVIQLLNGKTSVLGELENEWCDLIQENEIDGAIFFTDGECYLDEKYCNVPMLWVITADGTKPQEVPGKVVQMKK
jgi:predicted metal-dependent peptidase